MNIIFGHMLIWHIAYFNLLVSAEETIHTLRLCQNEQPIHLTCPREEQDVVLLEDSVFWGRRDPSPCLTEEDDLQALDTNCYSQEAARTVGNRVGKDNGINSLQRRHTERDGVSIHWRLDGLPSRLFRRRSKKSWPLWGEFTGGREILTEGQ